MHSFLRGLCSTSSISTRHLWNNTIPSIQNFSTKVSRKRKVSAKERKNAPLLKDTLKKLYLRTHPDLFGQYPQQRDANEQSFMTLSGLLDTIENDEKPFPPAQRLQLPFYLKTPVEGQFTMATLEVRTTGGACQGVLEKSLGDFFEVCGLNPIFKWGDGYWGFYRNSKKAFEKPDFEHQEDKTSYSSNEKQSNDNHGYSRHEETVNLKQDVETPSQAQTQAKSSDPIPTIEEALEQMDPALETIAAYPFLTVDENDPIKKQIIEALDLLESKGWNVRESTFKIWSGERDIKVLTEGLDADSAQTINRILLHTSGLQNRVDAALEGMNVANEG